MRRRRMLRDEDGVSELIGNILIVGITVLMAVGLSILIFALPGPVDTTQPTLTILLNPGPVASWGTGDENISILHRGGEALQAASTSIQIRGVSPDRTYQGNGLGSAFAGTGGFSIGDTWYSTAQPFTAQAGAQANVLVIAQRGSGSVLLANAQLVAGG